MSKISLITFSPTGTSLMVGEQIANEFEGEKVSIDLCEEIIGDIQMDREDIAIISLPCYGGRIPTTAKERLRRIFGNGARAIVCVTYGNRAFEDALLELADTVTENGFQVIAGCAAVTEHNIMHVFGQGRPDGEDLEEIQQFSKEVVKKLKEKRFDELHIPGNRPYKELHAAKTNILVDETTCISCGICASKCPVKAISADGLHVDMDVCINCMRCIKICPKKSRKISEEFVATLTQRLQSACEERKENQFFF